MEKDFCYGKVIIVCKMYCSDIIKKVTRRTHNLLGHRFLIKSHNLHFVNGFPTIVGSEII